MCESLWHNTTYTRGVYKCYTVAAGRLWGLVFHARAATIADFLGGGGGDDGYGCERPQPARVPAKTCQASSDLATRLSVM